MRWISAIGGAIVTAAGIAVLSSAMSAGSPSGAAPPPEAPPAPPPPLITTTTMPPTTTSTSAPTVDGLDPAVAGALADLGYTEFIPEGDLLAQLPQSVIDALVESGVVLVVEEGAATP
jgi:hypothetical protein